VVSKQDYGRHTSINALHGMESAMLACACLSCLIAVGTQVKVVAYKALVPFSGKVTSPTGFTADS